MSITNALQRITGVCFTVLMTGVFCGCGSPNTVRSLEGYWLADSTIRHRSDGDYSVPNCQITVRNNALQIFSSKADSWVLTDSLPLDSMWRTEYSSGSGLVVVVRPTDSTMAIWNFNTLPTDDPRWWECDVMQTSEDRRHIKGDRTMRRIVAFAPQARKEKIGNTSLDREASMWKRYFEAERSDSLRDSMIKNNARFRDSIALEQDSLDKVNWEKTRCISVAQGYVRYADSTIRLWHSDHAREFTRGLDANVRQGDSVKFIARAFRRSGLARDDAYRILINQDTVWVREPQVEMTKESTTTCWAGPLIVPRFLSDVVWWNAIEFVTKNSKMSLRSIAQNIIETYDPSNDLKSVGYKVTRTENSQDQVEFVVEVKGKQSSAWAYYTILYGE